MSEYSRVRKLLNFSDGELQRLTGYTRQGLRYSFELMKKGKYPNPRFFTGLRAAINERISNLTESKQREIDRYDSLIKQCQGIAKGADMIEAAREKSKGYIVYFDEEHYDNSDEE